MFDLRYHLASLTAVFVALVLGILIGIGLAATETVRESDVESLERRVASLQSELDAANARATLLLQEDNRTVVDEAYPALMHDRLAGKRFALVFAGSIDERVQQTVDRTLRDGGAEGVARVRALELPLDQGMLDRVLSGTGTFEEYDGREDLGAFGQDLASEFVEGGETPLWDALSEDLVEEQEGGFRRPVDGVVVARTGGPHHGHTTQFLAAFYSGLASMGVPAVGVETSDASPSAVESFRRRDLSTIDHLDRQLGRLALALLLAGGEGGEYGVRGEDGILPLPIDPVQTDEG